jgi:beta-phosphoglucomutase-like phosphatase (HAD superfamily)
MSNRAADAVLFDLDGTLVDSNYQHALAWYRAFRGGGMSGNAENAEEMSDDELALMVAIGKGHEPRESDPLSIALKAEDSLTAMPAPGH